jgi:hypothetical protein
MKNRYALQHPTSWKLFLGVLVATCAFAAAGYAQPIFLGKFTLPKEVHWGQAVLPAGVYYIRMDSMAAHAVVSSAGGDRTIFTRPPIIADSKQAGTFLTLTTMGTERTVRSLNLPELGKSVIFAPLTKSEQEELAKAGQSNTVPVVTARK